MYALIRATPENSATGVLLSLPDLIARSAHLLVLRVHCVILAPKDTQANIVKFAPTNALRETTAMSARMPVTRDLSVNNADMAGDRSPLTMHHHLGMAIRWWSWAIFLARSEFSFGVDKRTLSILTMGLSTIRSKIPGRVISIAAGVD